MGSVKSRMPVSVMRMPPFRLIDPTMKNACAGLGAAAKPAVTASATKTLRMHRLLEPFVHLAWLPTPKRYGPPWPFHLAHDLPSSGSTTAQLGNPLSVENAPVTWRWFDTAHC